VAIPTVPPEFVKLDLNSTINIGAPVRFAELVFVASKLLAVRGTPVGVRL
jgi:hypothetical protein